MMDAESSGELGPFPPPPPGPLEQDPYYLFRDELSLSLRRSLAQLEQWDALVASRGTASDEFHRVNAALLKRAGELRDDVRQLAKVVVKLSKHPHEFPDVTPAERDARKRFLDAAERAAKHVSARLSAPQAMAVIQQDAEVERKRREEEKRAALMGTQAAKARRRAARAVAAATAEDGDLEAPLHAGHVEHQALLLKEQDEALDQISSSLNTLSEAGQAINAEVDTHNRLLGEMKYEADSVMGQYDTAMKRLEGVLHATSRGETCGVVFLIIVLVVLIILVSVT